MPTGPTTEKLSAVQRRASTNRSSQFNAADSSNASHGGKPDTCGVRCQMHVGQAPLCV